MWVLMVLAVVWVVTLTPMVYRKLSERNSVTSVASFHRQLLRLGAAWRPARRTSIPGTALGFSAAALRVWEERYTPTTGRGRHIGGRSEFAQAGLGRGSFVEPRGDRDHRIPVPRGTARTRADVRLARPPLATVRRRRVVTCLLTLTCVLFLVGIIPAARMFWDMALISVAALLAYLAAIIHVHRLSVERARNVERLGSRRHVVSGLDEARQVRLANAAANRYEETATGRSTRGVSTRTGSSFGTGSAISNDRPEQEFAAGGR